MVSNQQEQFQVKKEEKEEKRFRLSNQPQFGVKEEEKNEKWGGIPIGDMGRQRNSHRGGSLIVAMAKLELRSSSWGTNWAEEYTQRWSWPGSWPW